MTATMTTTTRAMLGAYPASINMDRSKLAAAIDMLISCSQACTACADACLSEDQVQMLTKCIRSDLDCADICDTTARVLSRHTGYDANISRSLLEACITACKACGDECEQHAGMHEHCRICAEACRACERACRDLLATMS
ncbi:four-helix bundle copper-binding protein [Melissospora conviva]|uniref:four-helix bundle copper-binding protein n=1 Tax=Melissospora conviva TaxID=3388432 RepID=UPI003B82466A